MGKALVTDSFGKTTKKEIKKDLQLSIFPLYIKNITNMSEIENLQKEAKAREKIYQDEKKKFIAQKKYLFDFGSKEFVGKISKYGIVTEYQPVVSSDIFDEKKAWGFEKAANGDNIAKWISSNIEKDSCKVKDNKFIVKTKPGKYNVEIYASPFGKNPDMTVISGPEKIKLETSKESPIASVKLYSDSKISFIFNDWYNLAWIRISED